MRLLCYLCKLLLLVQLVFFFSAFYSKLLCDLLYSIKYWSPDSSMPQNPCWRKQFLSPDAGPRLQGECGALVYGYEMCGLNLVHVLWWKTKSESSPLCLQIPIDKEIRTLVCFRNLSGENKFAPAKRTKRLLQFHSKYSRTEYFASAKNSFRICPYIVFPARCFHLLSVLRS